MLRGIHFVASRNIITGKLLLLVVHTIVVIAVKNHFAFVALRTTLILVICGLRPNEVYTTREIMIEIGPTWKNQVGLPVPFAILVALTVESKRILKFSGSVESIAI